MTNAAAELTVTAPTKERQIVGRECKFAVLVKSKESDDDLHLVKENIHYDDQTVEPSIKLVKNYERGFYVAKKGFRDHTEKKEWEDISKLKEFRTTQTKLTRNIAKALGTPWVQGSQKEIQQSPYVYGSDILSTCLIRHEYAQKWPNLSTVYTNAAFDTETDVVHGTNETIISSIAYCGQVFVAVKKSFVQGWERVEERVQRLFQQIAFDSKHNCLRLIEEAKARGDEDTVKAQTKLVELMEAQPLKLELQFFDTEIEGIIATINKAHAWKPDFLSVWNLAYDIKKIMEACERAGVDIADVLSDPRVPKAYRQFKFKEGPAKRVTAAGRVMTFKPSQRWHTVTCASSFYWIDPMCVFRQVRQGKAEEPSYSLNAILKKYAKLSKLEFEATKQYTGLKWHQVMQAQYPIEYICYGAYDAVTMLWLDAITRDLQLTFPGFAGISDFANFSSQPRRCVDALHFFCLERNLVIASTGAEMATELDEETLSVQDWIIALNAHCVADNGLKLIEENPEIRTNIRGWVADLDVAASYPHGELVFNISKATTVREVVEFEGLHESVTRMQTINLSAGATNAVEFATTMWQLPQLDELLDAFLDEHPPTGAVPEETLALLP